MKFTCAHKAGERGAWTSDCGNYTVWMQAHPRESGPEWAAQYRGQLPWLCSYAVNRTEAQNECRQHARDLADEKKMGASK